MFLNFHIGDCSGDFETNSTCSSIKSYTQVKIIREKKKRKKTDTKSQAYSEILKKSSLEHIVKNTHEHKLGNTDQMNHYPQLTINTNSRQWQT